MKDDTSFDIAWESCFSVGPSTVIKSYKLNLPHVIPMV